MLFPSLLIHTREYIVIAVNILSHNGLKSLGKEHGARTVRSNVLRTPQPIQTGTVYFKIPNNNLTYHTIKRLDNGAYTFYDKDCRANLIYPLLTPSRPSRQTLRLKTKRNMEIECSPNKVVAASMQAQRPMSNT